jgi:hypothetical protein
MEGRKVRREWKMTKVWSDQCPSTQTIAQMVNRDKEMVRQILHDQLNMRKVCAKLVPKTLTHEQKDNQKDICPDIMKQITE